VRRLLGKIISSKLIVGLKILQNVVGDDQQQMPDGQDRFLLAYSLDKTPVSA